jgi:hypothetical protein
VAAVANREPSSYPFVGQVLARSSPVLTWRPALVAKATLERDVVAEEDIVDDRESSVQRVSRLPTTRMVVWPVIPRVRGSQSAPTILRTSVVAMLVVAALMALGVTAYASHTTGVAAASEPVAKVTKTRAIEDERDALISPPSVATVAPSAKSAEPPAKPVTPAASHGRAHHGKRRASAARR